MTPSLPPQSSSVSCPGDIPASRGDMSSRRSSKKKKPSKDPRYPTHDKDRNRHNNHILSKWGYSPQRKKRQSPKKLRVTHPPLSESSLGNYENDGIVNPYHMLQIRKDAHRMEIKQAYRRLALWHHPKRQQSTHPKERERRHHIFVILSACCETLLEEESRTRLDALLMASSNKQQLLSTPKTQGQKQPQPRPVYFQDKSTDPDHPILYLSHSLSSTDLSSSRPELEGVESWLDRACSFGNNNTPKASSNTPKTPTGRQTALSASCSTEEADQIHYSHHETNQLFGGPLSRMYQARLFRAFSDPFVIFDRLFGSRVFSSTTPTAVLATTPKALLAIPSVTLPSRSAAWTGSIEESLPNGTTTYTTAREIHARRLVKQEVQSIDPRTGQTKSVLTVTGEDLEDVKDEQNKSKELLPPEDVPIRYCGCWGPIITTTGQPEEDCSANMPRTMRTIFNRMNCVVW